MNFADALKVLALSVTRRDGVPLLAEKRLRQLMNVDAFRISTKSRGTALFMQHVNSAM